MSHQNIHPIVSVIIPAYNSEKTLEEAIASVVLQDVAVELILIDNASTDHTADVMLYCQCKWKSPQISWKVIHCTKNFGAAAARNLGVEEATAPYIAFLDSDDWWAEGKLKQQLKLLHETRGIICSTAREFATPVGKLTGHIVPVKQVITYRDLLHDNAINCSSVLITADVAKEFPMKYDAYHEDYITWLRILKKYKVAYGINEPLLKYRYWTGSKSSNKWKSMKKHYCSLRCVGIHPLKALWYSGFYVMKGIHKYWRIRRRYHDS